MHTQFNRRHFLRGTGALIALPALESIGFRRFALAASTA
ncbi:twin-arginine translocation signal domain-containing protein, partial [Verrucomicrobia bacterium]|nr:twin-arginine translocation signal domain-containing protein [Verrucomicrobiota bacterium]